MYYVELIIAGAVSGLLLGIGYAFISTGYSISRALFTRKPKLHTTLVIACYASGAMLTIFAILFLLDIWH